MNNDTITLFPLLGDLSEVPADYIRDVAHAKRFIERWTMDPKYRKAFDEDPDAAMRALHLDLTPDQVRSLVDRDLATELTRALRAGELVDPPMAALRYRAFIQEKVAYRGRVREEGRSANPRMAAWRSRQVNRCRGQLGLSREDVIVHAPAAFELAQGCTVGCWFCGVAAPKFDHWWPYDPANAALWRGTLQSLRDTIGDCARQGFLYWATDPLDNPDYERFLVDFHDVLGRCPQTTTAIAQKDVERTRRLLRLTHSLNSSVDRFSIIALSALDRVHEALSPEEMLRVECLGQNREAAPHHLKSNAGRARKFAAKRANELVAEHESSTIACVSGFLFNMVERSVRLITPCDADDRWPLGYWVLEEGTFDTAGELRELLRAMIDRSMRPVLGLSDVVRPRRDLRVEVAEDALYALSRGPAVVFQELPDVDDVAALLTEGTSTVEDIALRRERSAGVPLVETLSLLDHMFAEGLLDEEPPAPESAGVSLGMPQFAAQGAR